MKILCTAVIHIGVKTYGIIDENNGLNTRENETLNNIDYACTENCFAGSNRLTIQRLSQVHGVIRMTMAKFNIDIKYYAVMTAKKSVLEKLVLKKENGEKKIGAEL